MSGHLIGCVKPIKGLGKSHKLALVAYADSADDRTHVGFAGYEGVMEWADCSRSRAAELIKDLVTAGYLEPYRSARPGRRAEYLVFPHGCCALHRTPAAEGAPLDVRSLAETSGLPLEAVEKLLQAINTTPDNGSEIPDSNGSEISDPSGGDGSEKSDPSPGSEANGSEISDLKAERVQNASEISDPFTTSTTTPQPPAERGAPDTTSPAQSAGGGCAACRGQRPCRSCGTTPRQQEAAERRTEADRRRAEAQAAIQADRRHKGKTEHVDSAAHAKKARQLLAQSRTGGTDS